MKSNRNWVAHLAGGVISAVAFLSLQTVAHAEMSLEQALKQSVAHHPELDAERYTELSHEQKERIAKSNYLPKVSAMALWTTGFPGSAGATGIAGLMVSPFHKGPAAGLYLEQNIWDFGRTSGSVEVAKKETELSRKELQVAGLRVGEEAQHAYFACARDRSLSKIFHEIAHESQLIQGEVEKFVKVGQRSIVERYLAESQMEEAKTIADDFQKRYQLDEQKLALLTGEKNTEALCPFLDEQVIPKTDSGASTSESALLARAEAKTVVAQSEKSLAKADYNPRLVGIASLGVMQNTELGFEMKNYSAAVGFIFPLFEGFKTNAEVERSNLKLIQSEKEKEATQFKLDEANLNYSRGIESALIRIRHLREELKLAETGYQVAKKRYLALQGTLVDVREALRNLSRTSSDLKEALFDFATQSTERALVNGGWNSILTVKGE